MWFATYLYRCGLVTAEQVVEASIRQSDERIPLGRLALETKKLTVKDIAKILQAQTEGEQRFGKVAVRLGLLTERDVADLLMIQNDRLPSMGDVLVEMGATDRETMEAESVLARKAAAAREELLVGSPARA
jgi:hypothetical protein